MPAFGSTHIKCQLCELRIVSKLIACVRSQCARRMCRVIIYRVPTPDHVVYRIEEIEAAVKIIIIAVVIVIGGCDRFVNRT